MDAADRAQDGEIINMMDDFDKNFRLVARHQTARTVIMCLTVLALAYWILPVIIAAVKH